jgi:THO complex subunit 2
VKAITQSLYEQQKFNLLREENEGFAKLIVELNQPNISMANIDTVKKNVN